MSAPILTKKEQKKTLSAKKNRKKVQKNVLAAPDIIKTRERDVNQSCIPKITETLEVLLPAAKLPQNKTLGKMKGEVTEKSDETSVEASLIRNQLLLGINSISRGINNESAAGLLFADDVKPKMLITHLIVLCSLKNIPYLYIENLRGLTKKALGFSCIALGFKKESTFFLPLITLIRSAIGSENDKPTMEASVNNIETSKVKSTDEESITSKKAINSFTYLCRNSNAKRVFVPDLQDANAKESDDKNFLSIGTEDEVKQKFPNAFRKKITEGKRFRLNGNEITEQQINNAVYKKVKFNSPVEYSTTTIIKMGTNPRREKNKFVKLKKKDRL